LLAACSPGAAPQPVQASRPDVFLVIIDCLRADHVGAYGYPRPTTPNLDALAREGILFESAYTNSTWTKPSITTLFSGLYPSEHGLLKVGTPPVDEIETDVVPAAVPLLAEHLQANGYRTLAAVNQVHLSPELGFARGFDDYRWSRVGRSAFHMNEELVEALAQSPPDQPVFAWVHYLDAHWPYNRGPADIPQLGPTRIRPEPPKDQSKAVIEGWIRAHMNERNRRGLVGRYDREVREADSAFGQLVARLRELGRYDDAIVVVTADHGEGFFEHERLMHGFEPYEEVARVPLIVKLPAALPYPSGTRRTPVSHVDFGPTLVELLALDPFPGASGESWAPVLEGKEAEKRPVLVQAEFSASLRAGDDKLIRWLDGRVEHFDLASDPAERRDLAAGGCEGECLVLRGELERRLAELRPSPAGKRALLAAEDVEELRALGYL
jgi:arylsulfatase A-like enzyme